MSGCEQISSDICDPLKEAVLEYFVGMRLTSRELETLILVLPQLHQFEVRYPSRGAESRKTESLQAVCLKRKNLTIRIITSDRSHSIRSEYEDMGIEVHHHPNIERKLGIIREEVFIEKGVLSDDEIMDSKQNQRCDHTFDADKFLQGVLDINI